MTTPRVSLLVGTRNRPDHLRALLACLRLQTMPEWEVLVCDEGERTVVSELDRLELPTPAETVIDEYDRLDGEESDGRVRHVDCRPFAGDWHQSARACGAALARGEWLGFVPDDAYYCPRYLEFMLGGAYSRGWDLVYCDWVYDQAGYQRYEVAPVVGRVDVGGFLVRRAAYEAVGWPWRDHEGDGKFVVACAAAVPHGRVAHVLYVKN